MMIHKEIERTGLVEELAANRAKYASRRYVAPQDRIPRETKIGTGHPVGGGAGTVGNETAPAAPPPPPIAAIATSRTPSIADVQAVFCAMFWAEGGHNGFKKPITVDNLKSPWRNRALAWPRQVCMDLCRGITDESYPAIGVAFGRRDHTTVMHAISKAPEHLAESPILAATHARVLEYFRVMP